MRRSRFALGNAVIDCVGTSTILTLGIATGISKGSAIEMEAIDRLGRSGQDTDDREGTGCGVAQFLVRLWSSQLQRILIVPS